MDQESWMAEVKEAAAFRGRMDQFMQDVPKHMTAAAREAVTAHNDDKEAHPKQRLAFVLSAVALGASLLGPAIWDRVKTAIDRTGSPARAAEMTQAHR